VHSRARQSGSSHRKHAGPSGQQPLLTWVNSPLFSAIRSFSLVSNHPLTPLRSTLYLSILRRWEQKLISRCTRRRCAAEFSIHLLLNYLAREEDGMQASPLLREHSRAASLFSSCTRTEADLFFAARALNRSLALMKCSCYWWR
jgi:hypothetical protein